MSGFINNVVTANSASLNGHALTLAGALTTSGAFASTFTMTGATTVTFPTTGTLATTAQIPSTIISSIHGDIGSGTTGSVVSFIGGGPPTSTITFSAGSSTVGINFADAKNNVYIPGISSFFATGSRNTIFGAGIGMNITASSDSTYLGFQAGYQNDQTGTICIGSNAGSTLITSPKCIIIGNGDTIGDTSTTKIGYIGVAGGGGLTSSQSSCYIDGISGKTVTGTAVLCSTSGQLGTIASSVRYKENIEPIGESSSSILNMRPRSFNYKKDETKTKQYGLIAEEVLEDFPYLVFFNDEGTPESVKYHELPALLLNELIKLRKELDELKTKV